MHCARLEDLAVALELRGQGLACPFRHHTDVLHGEQTPPAAAKYNHPPCSNQFTLSLSLCVPLAPEYPGRHTQLCNSWDPT